MAFLAPARPIIVKHFTACLQRGRSLARDQRMSYTIYRPGACAALLSPQPGRKRGLGGQPASSGVADYVRYLVRRIHCIPGVVDHVVDAAETVEKDGQDIVQYHPGCNRDFEST